jgi:hypothetical protein
MPNEHIRVQLALYQQLLKYLFSGSLSLSLSLSIPLYVCLSVCHSAPPLHLVDIQESTVICQMRVTYVHLTVATTVTPTSLKREWDRNSRSAMLITPSFMHHITNSCKSNKYLALCSALLCLSLSLSLFLSLSVPVPVFSVST